MGAKAALLWTAAVWLASFPLAWWMLPKLVAQSTSKKYSLKTPLFWLEFVFYRLIIFAPYGVLLFSGIPISNFWTKLIWGWVLLGIFLSLLRFLGQSRVTSLLWWIYGFVYDGLNSFYPYRSLLDRVEDKMQVQTGMKILDLGCGTANLTKQLLHHQQDIRVAAVDSSKTMLWQAKRKLKEELSSGQAEIIESELLDYLEGQKSSTFDRIAMVNVVYAVDDRKRLWSECLRVLKPSGLIVATTSDVAKNNGIIKEHFEQDSIWKLLDPRLMAVGIIDYFISELAKTQVFHFLSQKELLGEVVSAGGKHGQVERAYGGANLLFAVKR